MPSVGRRALLAERPRTALRCRALVRGAVGQACCVAQPVPSRAVTTAAADHDRADRRRAVRVDDGVACRSCAPAAARASATRAPCALHGLARRARAAQQRPVEIEQRQQIAEREDRPRPPTTARSASGTRAGTRDSAAACRRCPSRYCGKNVKLKPTNSRIAAKRAHRSEYMRPVILGHQKWMPPR